MIKTQQTFKLKSLHTGKEFQLDKASYSIGRDPVCDIILDQGYPSRMHAQIIIKDGRLLIDDLNSTNGTFINNQRITKATQIRPGDSIKFSTCEFTLLSDELNNETVIQKKVPSSDDSFIVVEETADPDETALQQGYPLPFGWPVNDTFTKKLFKTPPNINTQHLNKIDQRIQQVLSKTDVIYVAALVFNPSAEIPMVFGLSLDSQQQTQSIGRSEECSFTINAPSVSEHHADLVFKQNKWLLIDCDSTNGISENGKLAPQLQLKHGSTVSFGQIEMVFRKIQWAL